MKKFKLALSLSLVIAVLFLTACGTQMPPDSQPSTNTQPPVSAGTDTTPNPVQAADPFKVFDPPITITAMMLEDNIRNVPEGMTLQDNPWVNKFREYGINVEYTIVGSAADLETQLNLAISDKKLPDIISATPQQFADLAEGGYLADLTDVYNSYVTSDTKAMFEQDGGLMMKNGVVDGKLYGLVQPQGYEDFVGIASIRSDWLAEAGLSEPQTMSDIWNIAKTFKERKMDDTCTVGIGLTKNVLDLLTPSLGLLNAYHGYSNIWLEIDNELVNSSIQPEMKTALSKLADYYQQGIIDPEFGSKDATKQMEDAISGKAGVVISHFCAPFDTLNGVKNGQEWAYFRLPSDDDQPVKAQQSIGFSGAVGFNAKSEHPEAMIIMYNLFTKFVKEDMAIYNDNAVRNFAYPTITAFISGNNDTHLQYLSFLETGEKPDTVFEAYDSTVEAAEKWRLNQDPEGYVMWAIFGPGGTEEAVTYAKEHDGYIINKFTGAPTPSMDVYSANLKTLEEQMVTYIIQGTKPIDYFDEFVDEWRLNGGDAITKEVNDWYNNQE